MVLLRVAAAVRGWRGCSPWLSRLRSGGGIHADASTGIINDILGPTTASRSGKLAVLAPVLTEHAPNAACCVRGGAGQRSASASSAEAGTSGAPREDGELQQGAHQVLLW